MQAKHWFICLTVAVIVMGLGIMGHIRFKECPKCPPQKECVPSLTSCIERPMKPDGKIAKPTPKRARPVSSGLKWKGQNLPTNLKEAKYLAQRLFKNYWDKCLAKFTQGPFDGLISCVEWSKIEGEWLTGFKKETNPKIEFWARVVAQYALNYVSNVVCTNSNPYFKKNPMPVKLYGKKRKAFLKWRELLKKRAKKNEARWNLFIRGLGHKVKNVPELPFPKHISC